MLKAKSSRTTLKPRAIFPPMDKFLKQLKIFLVPSMFFPFDPYWESGVPARISVD
jgi:hypothetical protein